MFRTINLRRRDIARALASIALLPAQARSAIPLCGANRIFGDSASPLTIDVHAHIFNGSDLQIKEFLTRVVMSDEHSELRGVVEIFGGLLQRLAWATAPTCDEEIATLERYAMSNAECFASDRAQSVTSPASQDGYVRGRRALQTASRQSTSAQERAAVLGPRVGLPGAGLGAAIEALPPTLDAFERELNDSPSVLGSQPHFWGYLQYVLHHFNYRHVNALNYFSTYSQGSARRIDLLIASLVDFDWWLARGRSAHSTLDKQVDALAKISILLGGRVHGFVAFCPFREAMTEKDGGDGTSMRLVKRAVETQGFIGVKLYPPMGFAAWGNGAISAWKGKQWLPPAAFESAFGARLDKAMQRLFEWCIQNDVPIMAHANESNGPHADFRALARSEHWKLALERFPDLKVSFGHFGDSDLEDHEGKNASGYIELMTSVAGSAGANVFADSGFFAGVLSNPTGMTEVLTKLYAGSNGNVLVERLMYGTDWLMTLSQKNVSNYLSEFIGVMELIDVDKSRPPVRQKALTDAFFGINAVAYLGLEQGKPARQRLEAFYERHRVAEPEWMKKL